jgi:hypothetical protein
MAGYLGNPKHGLRGFSELEANCSLPIGTESLAGKSKPFVRALNGFGNPGTLSCLHAGLLPNARHLRVYSVTHIPRSFYEFAWITAQSPRLSNDCLKLTSRPHLPRPPLVS